MNKVKKNLALCSVMVITGGLCGYLAMRYRDASRPRGEESAEACKVPEKPARKEAAGKTSSSVLSPPRFTSANDNEFVPGAPGYDPARAAKFMGVSSVFSQEPVDPSWAPVIEKYLADNISKDLPVLVPQAKNFSVECRTTTCRVSLDANAPIATQFEGLVYLYPGSVYTQEQKSVILAFAGGSHSNVVPGDATSLIDNFEQWRARAIRSRQRDLGPNVIRRYFTKEQFAALEK